MASLSCFNILLFIEKRFRACEEKQFVWNEFGVYLNEKKYTDNLHEDIKLCKPVEFNYIVFICTVPQAQFYVSFSLAIDTVGCISHSLKAEQSFQVKNPDPFCVHNRIQTNSQKTQVAVNEIAKEMHGDSVSLSEF